jgi:hypothetical protein
VDPGVLERAGPIAGRVERAHQAQRHPAVARLDRREPAPPPHRSAPCRRLLALFGKSLQRAEVPPGEPGPFGIHPLLEAGGIGEVKAVEQRPGVGPDRRLEPAVVEQALELGDIGVHALGIEPELVARCLENVLAERAPELVERVREQAARPVGVGLRPEQRQDLVPAERAPPGQERQQSKLPPAPGAPRHRSARAFDGAATEKLERQHVVTHERSAREARERRDAAATA